MTSELVLLVDDEPYIIQLSRLYLEREGFHVQAVGDGLGALKPVDRLNPTLVILYIKLPGLDGLEVGKRLHASNELVPILMLTARDEDNDKILGLELGADNYMTKPFNPRELVARVKAILRRSGQLSDVKKNILGIGDMILNPARREVTCQGQSIGLRTQEFEGLTVLAKNKGLVLSREQLLSQTWGFDFYGQTRTGDVHIAQHRRKMAVSQVRIEPVTGVGYKLVG
jgi:two-component system, OmpR family, alkaline phosphatase synthesis response regulator PhoP